MKLKIPAVLMDLFILLAFFFLVEFVQAVLLMNVAQQEIPTAKPKTEIIITQVWDETDQDLDMWITRVGHEVCGYSSRETGPFILHGDHTSAMYGQIDGVLLKEATETISINQLVPGNYVLSIYGFRVAQTDNQGNDINPEGVMTTVEVLKVSPFRRVVKKEVWVSNHMEVPICRFRINSDKEIVDLVVDEDILDKDKFLKKKKEGE